MTPRLRFYQELQKLVFTKLLAWGFIWNYYTFLGKHTYNLSKKFLKCGTFDTIQQRAGIQYAVSYCYLVYPTANPIAQADYFTLEKT